MKLFFRALLFFIAVVIFQSTLTIFLVEGIVTRSNEADARLELENSSKAVYESYTTWVRRLWKTVVKVNKDEEFKKIAASFPDLYNTDDLRNWSEEILLLSGMDFVVLKVHDRIVFEYFDIGNTTLGNGSLREVNAEREHPYIELRKINGGIYLTGILEIDASKGLELFILKKIDTDFYKQTSLPAKSKIFMVNSRDTSFGNDAYAEAIKTMTEYGIPFRTIYSSIQDGHSYNIAFRNLGRIKQDSGEDNLIQVLLISNDPYQRIVTRINKTLLTVSMIVSLFAILLSFFLSDRITRPISLLIRAMEDISKGNYRIKIAHGSRSEVGKLFQGFNEMANQLDQNKKDMESYIQEITFLKDYNEKIIHSLRAGIMVIGNELGIEKVNGFFLECFHLEEQETLGKFIDDLHLDIIDQSVLGSIKEIICGEINSKSTTRRVGNLVFEIKLYPLRAVNSNKDRKCVLEIDDVSKKFELEEKIFQAEKLSSLSILSAGISHEINNPLSSILTNVQNLLAEKNEEETRTALVWIEQETKRIAKIVNELLDFSASETKGNEGTDVNSSIREVVRLINYGLEKDKRIRITTNFQDKLPLAVISSSELKQVIINLIQNSIFAIEERGQISITTSLKHNNQGILIEIKDTGSGMDKETMQYIFDPFFTTKPNGKGTGLGLSIVYGIINKFSGEIDVQSAKGSGTTVILTIPVLKVITEYQIKIEGI